MDAREAWNLWLEIHNLVPCWLSLLRQSESYSRLPQVLRETSKGVFVPLTIGGGIKDVVDPDGTKMAALQVAAEYFRSGADKVGTGEHTLPAHLRHVDVTLSRSQLARTLSWLPKLSLPPVSKRKRMSLGTLLCLHGRLHAPLDVLLDVFLDVSLSQSVLLAGSCDHPLQLLLDRALSRYRTCTVAKPSSSRWTRPASM